jgi:nifR3 family TIM-barrel protein
MNFWKELDQPYFALAPMEDVTDTVFREVVLSTFHESPLKILFTEFTNVDGLCHPVGREKVSHRLMVNASERKLLQEKGVKLVAQIWGNNPDKFYQATKMLTEEYQFDGIDINMGCPVKKVVKSKCCSALIQYPQLAKEIVKATQEATHLPVSVKTRIGFNHIQTEEWISHLLEVNPAAITIHGRIQKQLSDGEANWEEIAKAVQLNSDIPIIGNGDVISVADGMQKANETGVNGLMIGRGIFNNPWMFAENQDIDTTQRLQLIRKHIQLFESTWRKTKNPNILKRFFKIYINGFTGASTLRNSLMTASGYEDFYSTLDDFSIRNK